MSHARTAEVEALIEMAKCQRLAVLYYRKGVTRHALPPRLIEPYCFVEGRQDLMIRCYQLEVGGDGSESGWRFFMSHKIERVEPTTVPFRPRRRITLPTGEIAESAAHNEHWAKDGRRAYRDLVGDALADGKLTSDELAECAAVRARHQLSEEDIRYVHAAVYYRCLGAVLDDGFITAHELTEIRFLHRAMRALGWALGD